MTGRQGADRPAVTPAVRQGVSVGVATGLYGIGFGALAVASGLSVAQTCALSLLMFTGGSQFAFIGILGGGGSGVSATATAGLLGVRNSLYSLQLVPLLRTDRRGPVEVARRAAAAQLTIDESTAVCLAQPDDAERRRGFWVTGVAVHLFWNLFTLVGALTTAAGLRAGQEGSGFGDPQVWGLDGAAVAAFVALLWPRLRTADAWAVAVLAGVVALLLVPAAPAGIPVLAAAVVAAGLTSWRTRRSA